MDFSPAESQLLATLCALESRDEEWWENRRSLPTRERLRQHGALFFDTLLQPWDEAFEALRLRGLLDEIAGYPRLTADGRPPAEELRHDFRRQRFAEMLVQSESSAAYRIFWQRTSDLDFCAFSLLDKLQLDAVVDALELQPGQRLLDAGCGTGRVTEEIARRQGCQATGVELADEAVQAASRRTDGQRDLHFMTLDLSVPFARKIRLEDFDAVLAIDSLVFLDDLEGALRRLAGCRRPGGTLAALCLEIAPSPTAGVEELPTAQALGRLGLPYETLDLTKHCLGILRARQFAARALGPRFRKEGHPRLGRALTQEGERLQPHLEAGTLRRLLYRVGPRPVGSAEKSSADRDSRCRQRG